VTTFVAAKAAPTGSDPLVAFLAAGLRSHGVAVSPAEVLDAHRAMSAVGVADRSLCLAALRATLVKQGAHDRVFDQLIASARQAGLVQDRSHLIEQVQRSLNLTKMVLG